MIVAREEEKCREEGGTGKARKVFGGKKKEREKKYKYVDVVLFLTPMKSLR